MIMELCFIESQIFMKRGKNPGQKLTKQVFLTSRVYCRDFMLPAGVSVSNLTSPEGSLANTKGGVNSRMSLVNVIYLSNIKMDYHVLKTFNGWIRCWL